MTETYRQIQDICLRLLARREHSQKELRDKLSLRGFEPDESARAIEELAEQGWQSDSRYAESYARQRIEKGYGPLRIGYELHRHGIDDIDLEAMVDELAGNWFAVMKRVYLDKYDNADRLTAREWLKRSRFLQQRGFGGALIKTLFEQLNIRLER